MTDIVWKYQHCGMVLHSLCEVLVFYITPTYVWLLSNLELSSILSIFRLEYICEFVRAYALQINHYSGSIYSTIIHFEVK